MPDIQKSFIGVGRVLARAYGSTGRRRHVGNVSALAIAHTLDTKEQKDYTRPGGGTLVKVERIESVDATMTWLSFSKENFALAVAGNLAEVVGGTATDEVVEGHLGSTVLLAHPPLAITSVVDAATGLVTYVAGEDYEKSPGGLFIPEGSSIVDEAELEVTYTYGAYTNIEAAMKTSSELELVFEGLNEADSNKPAIVYLHRLSVPSANELALIGDDFAVQEYAAELLKDSTKGAGVSAFYKAVLPA